jgi:ATP-dependent DNA helicase RecG
MSLYGDLDISVIDELPPGRKPFKRCIVLTANRLKVWKFIRDEIGLGRQIYIVMIQESAKMDFKDLMDGYESVSRLSITGLFHFYFTRKDEADKDAEMKRFSDGKILWSLQQLLKLE